MRFPPVSGLKKYINIASLPVKNGARTYVLRASDEDRRDRISTPSRRGVGFSRRALKPLNGNQTGATLSAVMTAEPNSSDALALAALDALGQRLRLALLRRLLDAWPQPVASGALARLCAAPPTTVSGHLAVLARAGLVRAERRGTTVDYRAVPAALRRLIVKGRRTFPSCGRLNLPTLLS